MTGRGVDLLALFPSFESPVFGGVQASGREAWRTIAARQDVSSDAFFYEPATGRFATMVAALRRRAQAGTVLVWHCGLLRLVPFIAAGMASGKGRSVIFLHGIEAWKEHDCITRFLMRRTSLFLTNSDHTWRRFAAVHPECAATAHRTVHLGAGALPEAFQYPDDGPPAGIMIGRLSRGEDYKGHRELIQAWPRLLQRMADAELWIVGEGDLRPELEQTAAALGLESRVRFFGAVPDATRNELLRKSRAMLLPSAGEGFGLVYLEAMRMGRPCLVSTIDAGKEVVNPPEAGLAVRLDEPEHTVDAVVRLLSPGPQWDAMSVGARRRYEANFTARHFEERLLAALFDV